MLEQNPQTAAAAQNDYRAGYRTGASNLVQSIFDTDIAPTLCGR
jgi:hypothetical protein